jgi:hypothetical protein
VPLLAVGLLLSWASTPGWTELILVYPNRFGGIAATAYSSEVVVRPEGML